MMKRAVIAIAMLMCAGTAFAAGPVTTKQTVTVSEPEYPYQIPKRHDLSEGVGYLYQYTCIDGYVFVNAHHKLAQLIVRDEEGLPVPAECPVCKGGEK